MTPNRADSPASSRGSASSADTWPCGLMSCWPSRADSLSPEASSAEAGFAERFWRRASLLRCMVSLVVAVRAVRIGRRRDALHLADRDHREVADEQQEEGEEEAERAEERR